VHEEAEAVAAQSWNAPGSAGSELAVAGVSDGVANTPQPDLQFSDAVSDMLKRMDETLAMIRRVKAGSR
jgi:hypothetical protein